MADSPTQPFHEQLPLPFARFDHMHAEQIREAADKFADERRNTMNALVLVGKTLIEAKASVRRGEFGRLFHGHPRPVADALPFTPAEARNMMRVAAHPVLSDPELARLMPVDHEVLYVLAHVPVHVLKRGIQDGLVNWGMELREAKKFLRTAGRRTDLT